MSRFALPSVLPSATLAILLSPLSARAQLPPPTAAPADPTDLVRVFLDCDRCDSQHLRQTVGFVDYVLDRAVAEVHVLVTTQTTGGGGLEWRVQFIGVARFRGHDLTLTFVTAATDTDDDRRNAFARIFRLGLASQAAATRAAPQLDVTWTAPTAGAATATRDPWDYWVFNLRANGNTSGERSRSSLNHSMSVSANRTTDNLKVALNANGNTDRSEFKIEDADPIKSRRHSWSVNGRIVKSLGPHWSTGATGGVSHSSFSNLDRSIALAPAIEFSVFPYSESSRRRLTLHYAAGAIAYKYTELTIYDHTEETVPRHGVAATLSLQQPWGDLSISSRFSQFLLDLDQYRGSIWTSADVRLFKGFSFNVAGEYERIKDQISLRKEEATEQEVLLRIQQQATGYSYFFSFGISYRFGSIFNNVVNTRFDGSLF